MSKQTARSWKLVIITTTVMVAASVLILNVGASAHRGKAAPVVQQSASASASSKPSGSPKASATPPSNCQQVGPTCIPTCAPMVNPCPSGSPPKSSPSTGSSPTASTSPTPGGGDTYKSTISIAYSNKRDSFKGRVDSRSVCEKGRRVDLFEVSPGKDTNLGHTVTLKKGKYKIPFPNPNGRYYTKVKKSTPSRNVTCKGAQSKTISE